MVAQSQLLTMREMLLPLQAEVLAFPHATGLDSAPVRIKTIHPPTLAATAVPIASVVLAVRVLVVVPDNVTSIVELDGVLLSDLERESANLNESEIRRNLCNTKHQMKTFEERIVPA